MHENDMYKIFIALQEYINSSKDDIKVYYEEASKQATMPYGVISDPVETRLNYGKLIYFDINIWSKEPDTGVALEEKVQSLINLIDKHIFSDEKAVIYFESQRPVADPEFELIKRQITFSIRLF